MKIKEKVIELIMNNLSVIFEDVEIQMTSNLFDDLGFSSLTIIQLLVEIEEEFEIVFGDALLVEDLITVQNMITTVENLVKQRSSK